MSEVLLQASKLKDEILVPCSRRTAYLVVTLIADTPTSIRIFSEEYPTIHGRTMSRLCIAELSLEQKCKGNQFLIYGDVANVMDNFVKKGSYDHLSFVVKDKVFNFGELRHFLYQTN
jgi:hypothetical protein